MPWAAPVTIATLFSNLISDTFRDQLRLEVLLEPGDTHLATDARLLVAAERRVRAEPDTAVDREGPGADPVRDRPSPLQRAAVDRAGEPVGRLVGDPDRVVVAVVRDHHQDRSEDLLLCDARGVVQ